LLLTKLVPPRLPSRPVALERHKKWIDVILRRRVCLVRAPSGYGKSTTAASWYHAFSGKNILAGWVSFEPDDDNPISAISYILNSVKRATSGTLGLDVGLDENGLYDGLTPVQSIAARLINAIHDAENDFVLFLDDFDRLTHPQILQFVNYLVVHGPDSLHLVVVCKAQPALPLVYLDSHNLLLRIGMEILRLRDDEAIALLSNTDVPLKKDDIMRLNDAMDGWITGLRIGSAALQNNTDALFDIGLVTHGAQWLSDYLEENIFQHLTAPVGRFLMRCSVVEMLDDSLCRALTGEEQSGEMLSWLADQNLFIQHLDSVGSCYRMHPVFREFLQTRLLRNEPGIKTELSKIASSWFADKGRINEAINHALEAGDPEGAAKLIESTAMKLVERSDILTLLGWIARIPEKYIADRLPVRLAQAWALTLSLRPQVRSLLNNLKAKIEKSRESDNYDQLKHELAGIETIFIAVYEDELERALDYGNLFLSSPIEEDRFVSRAVRNATAHCESLRGNHHLVHELIRPAQIRARKIEQLFTTAYRHCVMGASYRAQGQSTEAERTFQAGYEIAVKRSGKHSPSTALLSAYLARSLYERNDIDGAIAKLEGNLPIIGEACFHDAVINAYFVSIRIAAIRSDTDAAASLIEHAELIGHERQWKRLLAMCMVERHRLQLPQTMGENVLIPDSSENALIARPLSLDTRTYAILVELLASVAHATRDFERVAELANFLARFSTAVNNQEIAIKARLIGLMPGFDAGPDEGVVVEFTKILQHAIDQGFLRTPLDTISSFGISDLSFLTGAKNVPPEFLPFVYQSEFSSVVGNATIALKPIGGSTIFSILTSREIDVLTGVGRGDSNKGIARQLHLTPETVKWHLKNVMRKLGAGSRAEAVRNASALGLSLKSD